MQPLLSIVIANYNYGRFLEEAIQSVVNQDMGDQVELIICDAASTDDSVEIIKKYAYDLPPNTSYYEWTKKNPSSGTNSQHATTKITWWCSEPDGGQSAAFNKGFSHARGRFLTWLNADDVLLPGALKAFSSAVKRYPDTEWFVGGSIWLDPKMSVYSCHPARSFSALRLKCGVVSTWGPSSFFSKKLLDFVGGIDERFHYKMDSDLWLRFAHGANVRYIPVVRYAYGLRLHPDAKMSGHNFSESPMSDEKHPKWEQLRNEQQWMNEHFHPSC